MSHTEKTIQELHAERQFAETYLKATLEKLDNSNNRAAGLLCDIAEA